MSVTGIVTSGVVVLPAGTSFPEGTAVTVDLVPQNLPGDASLPALWNVNGVSTGCPDDLAANHDYYIHGHSRKQQPRRGRWISSQAAVSTLSEQQATADGGELRALAAETSNLPADLSANHDHYLHGRPKL
jgi:hypothetical protein